VLDTVALQALAFAHPDGIAILLATLGTPSARFPAEVYNQDEDTLPLETDDALLSELARGLRYARRQVASRPPAEGQRYATWLRHAAQLHDHLVRATLVIDPLTVEELPLREHYQTAYGLGRGEAACLVLSRRYGAAVIFLSSDTLACEAADNLGLPFLTLSDVLMAWVDRLNPPVDEVDALVAGMRAARFGLTQEVIDELRQRARA
jgi:hypothetical protein